MTPDEALAGLTPSLIIDLANLALCSAADLAVTIQLMPFGGRATLLAYGAIRYDKHRTVLIEPFLYDLIDASLTRVCDWARTTGFR